MALRRSPQSLVDAFDAALPRDELIERRKMFGFPAAFVNGNLFCGLHQDDVIVRLSAEQRAILEREGGSRWEPTPGRVMREYMTLPQGADRAAMKRWLARSLDFARSLPPKLTKVRKAKRSR